MLTHLTASMRFEGSLNVDLNEVTMNLVPFPNVSASLATHSLLLLLLLPLTRPSLASSQLISHARPCSVAPPLYTLSLALSPLSLSPPPSRAHSWSRVRMASLLVSYSVCPLCLVGCLVALASPFFDVLLLSRSTATRHPRT